MFKSIVVGIDGSDASDRALRMACTVARDYGSHLLIVHTPKNETATYAADAISGFYVGPNVAQLEALREAAEKLGADARTVAIQTGVTKVDVHIGTGDPALTVLEQAEQAGADLIVTGRRGLGNFAALVLGSTSGYINKHAVCACLTVP